MSRPIKIVRSVTSMCPECSATISPFQVHCAECGTPIPAELELVFEIIQSNAEAAVDQRREYDSLQDSLDSFYDNARDTLTENGLQESQFLPRNPRAVFMAYAAAEAKKQRVRLPKSR